MKRKTLTMLLAVLLVTCSSCSGKKAEETSSINLNSSEQSSNTESVAVSSEIPKKESSEIQETVAPASSSSALPPSSSSSKVSSIQVLEDIKQLDNTKIGWGPGKVVDHKAPSYALSSNELYRDYDAIFVGNDSKNIYLTFDEGYENGYTAPILDTLKNKDVKAVFFVTYDYVNRNPELVKRMIDEGHILGNHSWSHPSMPSLNEEKMVNEVMRLHNLVCEKFNYEMKYFRPPMGEFSKKSLAVCKQLGYKSVFWSFAYVDWNMDNQPDEAKSLERVSSAAHPGAIYLLHAVSKTNSNILADVIDNVRAQGYTFSEFNL